MYVKQDTRPMVGAYHVASDGSLVGSTPRLPADRTRDPRRLTTCDVPNTMLEAALEASRRIARDLEV